MDQYIYSAISAERSLVEKLIETSIQCNVQEKLRKIHYLVKVAVTVVGIATLIAVICGVFQATSIVWGVICLIAGALAHHRINEEELHLKNVLENTLFRMEKAYKWIGFKFIKLLHETDDQIVTAKDKGVIRTFFSSTTTIYGNDPNQHNPVQFRKAGNELLRLLRPNDFSVLILESTDRQIKLAKLIPYALDEIPPEYVDSTPSQGESPPAQKSSGWLKKWIQLAKFGLSKLVKVFKNPLEVWNQFKSALSGKNGNCGQLCAFGQLGGGIVMLASAGVAWLGFGALGMVIGASALGLSTYAVSVVPKGGLILKNLLGICDLVSCHLKSFNAFLSDPLNRKAVFKVGILGILIGWIIGLLLLESMAATGSPQLINTCIHLSIQVLWVSSFAYGYTHTEIIRNLASTLISAIKPFGQLFENVTNGNIKEALIHLKVIHEVLKNVQNSISVDCANTPFKKLKQVLHAIVEVLRDIILFGDSMTTEGVTDLEIVQTSMAGALKNVTLLQPSTFKKLYFKIEAFAKSSIFWISLFCAGEIVVTSGWLIIFFLLEASAVIRLCLLCAFAGTSLFVFRVYFESALAWIQGTIENILSGADHANLFLQEYLEYCAKTDKCSKS